MEIANFLGKLKGSEHVEPKKFLALILTDEVVQASVWHVPGVHTEIVAIGTPVEWDGDTGTTSQLITAVDATISSAVEGLEVEPNEVILGIPHSWTEKDGILGVKKEFISKIRKDLELEAIGYVIITDSV
jgi:RNase H-fold protein (predicted Holliday junction resolvase)